MLEVFSWGWELGSWLQGFSVTQQQQHKRAPSGRQALARRWCLGSSRMCRKWLRSELCAAKLLYTLLGKRFTAHLQRWDDRKKYQTQKPLQLQIIFLKLDFANMSPSWVYNILKCCLTSWNSWTRSPALIKSALWRSAYSSLWGSVYDMMQSTNASASVAHGG